MSIVAGSLESVESQVQSNSPQRVTFAGRVYFQLAGNILWDIEPRTRGGARPTH